MQDDRRDVEAFYVEFGRRLRAARTVAGMSQEALGIRVGLNRTSISNIEKGRQRILLHQLPQLADSLQTTIDTLLPLAMHQPDVMSEIPEDAQQWVRSIIANDSTAASTDE
ncbi:helix-turn-helix domain-containing protein [Pseudonocardia cypriaca]|uniref:helix-turn-helix domain-containing protein n=1 Tax=Pseudonocardia cypriaca TaxID=882449 RepID=UPI0014770383|nr:helix-turn-helix transcriptional regulator [Pseudonocardia cypriaca]